MAPSERTRRSTKAKSQSAPSDYLDTSGHRLEDYPRPSVAVDTAVLTVQPGPPAELSVLVVRRIGVHRRGTWQLPGTFLHPGETLADAALRALRDKAGVTGLHPRQLQVLDAPDRDDRGWVISAAHADAVPADQLNALDPQNARLVSITQAKGLAFDHDIIVAMAVDAIRSDYEIRPDPAGLLPGPFTLLQLQRLHEAVAGHVLPKDTFRRRMQDQLRETGSLSDGIVGKPARLWQRIPSS